MQSNSPQIQMAVDPTKEIFRRFEALDDKEKSPLHATYVIDSVGRIRWSTVGGEPFMDSEVLLREVSLIRSGATTLQEDERPDRPKIYLDKSPRIIAYQLKRLNNERLLLVERKTSDPKYIPVFDAILTRAGMSPQYREEALEALAKLSETDTAAVLLNTLGKIPTEKRQDKQTAMELTKMFFAQPNEKLAVQKSMLAEATSSDSNLLRQVGFAGLVLSDDAAQSWQLASDCLLYTSPSPRDQRGSRMPSSA